MDELIARLTSKLGINDSIAKAATEKALAMLKEHAGDDLFGQIADKVPGAAEMAEHGVASGAATAGDGGLLGKLAGMASSALGKSAGGGLELGAALSETGLKSDQMGGFVSMIIEFLKEKVGDDVMEQVLGKFPMLKSLMG